MTPPDRDYDDVLRRALRSAMDPIEPTGDGLTKIRQRLTEPWLRRQLSLLRSEFSALGWLIAVRSEPLLSGIRSGVTARAGTAGQRLRSWLPALGVAVAQASPGRHQDAASHGGTAGIVLRRWIGPTMAWLRPALAVAGAVVIVVAGVFALGPLRQTLFVGSLGSSSSYHGGKHGAGAGPASGTNGHGPAAPLQPHPTKRGSAGRKSDTTKHHSGRNGQPPSDCSTSPGPSPTPTNTGSPTPTNTGSPTPTNTGSPTPTGTSTATSGPAGQAHATDTGSTAPASAPAPSCAPSPGPSGA